MSPFKKLAWASVRGYLIFLYLACIPLAVEVFAMFDCTPAITSEDDDDGT